MSLIKSGGELRLCETTATPLWEGANLSEESNNKRSWDIKSVIIAGLVFLSGRTSFHIFVVYKYSKMQLYNGFGINEVYYKQDKKYNVISEPS